MTRAFLRSATAAIPGRAHGVSPQSCDDAVGHVGDRKAWALCVLADGAGSAPLGGHGARLAVAEALRSSGVRTLLSIARDVRERLVAEARTLDTPLANLATTLLLCRTTLSRDGVYIDVFHVGDGAVVVGNTRHAQLLSGPRRGEHVNETSFLTSESWESSARSADAELSLDSGVLLMSDGPMPMLVDVAREKVAPACIDILTWGLESTQKSFEAALHRALKDVMRDGTSDDLSLACSVAVKRS